MHQEKFLAFPPVNRTLYGVTVAQLVQGSPLVLGFVGSISAHAMWTLWWTNTVRVGFLGVLPFPPTFFIQPIHLIIIHTA